MDETPSPEAKMTALHVLDRAEPGAEDGRERDHWDRCQIPVLYYRFGNGTGTTGKTEK